jgi:4-hydroxybenzoate polyprenyltransferase
VPILSNPSGDSAAAAVASAGLALFGVNTGLDPVLLIAGLAGALMELSYGEPRPAWRRLTGVVSAALLAGYVTPAAMAIGHVKSLLPEGITEDAMMPAAAASIGFLSYRVIGPAILRVANKFSLEQTK